MDDPVDFVVLGSTPLALLLAGLLAGVHGKTVALVAEAHSAFRLTRGFDLSVAPLTRPETWALLQRTVPEVQKLLASFRAKPAIERIDPVFVAETEDGAEALMHLRYLLVAHGIAVERLATNGAGASWRLRDALMLRRAQLAAAAADWHAKAGVLTIPADGAAITLRRDGARIERDGAVIEAAQVIAADDGAILSHTGAADRDPLLRTDSVATVLTEPMKSLPARLTLVVDRGLMLYQRKGGMVDTLAAGGADAVARAGARLSAHGRLRRAGQTGFGVLVPVDGSPLVGPVKALKASVVCGFGPVAAFLAPAIARYFAGAPGEDERAYFAAREATGEGTRSAAADFSGAIVLGSAS